LPGVAHLIALEAPELVAGLIVDFLRPLGTW
jgi:pimeloyl-ACP methyl ester carboxylesterase